MKKDKVISILFSIDVFLIIVLALILAGNQIGMACQESIKQTGKCILIGGIE